ncbi:MAG TPA: S1 RNA-binding domain-containing protein, partial [Rugosibacter sp.]|nr:S1 RNA-binding domain-containing protein [Rugosibacter sp.]
KDPHDVVKAGDVVQVKVLEVDLVRKRIALTLRMSDEPGSSAKAASGMQRVEKVGAGETAIKRADHGKKPANARPASPAQPGGAMADAFARLKR